MENREPHHGVVGPVILISLGVIFLFNNLGWLDWSVWATLLRLWPVLLIGAGLDILIGRRSVWGSLLVALLLLAVGAGAICFYQTRASAPSATAESVEQDLQGASQARVVIDPGVGQLHLNAMDDADTLLSGRIDLERGERLTTDADLSGDTLDYSLSTDRDEWNFWGPWGMDRNWQISLTSEVPIGLTVDTGVGSAEIDLRQLTITDFVLNTGVGSTVVTLPATGDFSAAIDGGVGLLVVRIPEGVAARIEANGGLAPVSASPGFERRGDTYFTPGYEEAQDRLDVQVDLGIGSLRLEIVSPG